MKVTVVYDTKTKKIIPFKYGDMGEVIITITGYHLDNLIVSRVEATRLDLFNGYILEEGQVYVEE